MATELKNIKRKFSTTEAGLTLLAKQWGYGEDTRRITVCEDDGTTKRYFWDSTRLADQTGTYGAALIGIDGITGVTPDGGSSGAAGTVRAMIRGIGAQLNFGSLTTNVIPRKNSSNVMVDSAISDNGTTIAMTRAVTMSLTLGVTGVATFTAAPVLSALTASLPVFTNGSKALVSNAITGTGSVVMSASPTLTGTVTAAAMTLSSTLAVTGITTFSGDLLFAQTTHYIRANTSDGSDNKMIIITAGGTSSDDRGASIQLRGNEFASLGGQIEYTAGNAALGTHVFYTANTERMRIAYDGTVTIGGTIESTSGIAFAGGSAVLDHYSYSATSVSWTTGFSGTVTADVRWERIGNIVILRFDPAIGTSNSATMSTSSGALPLGIRPSGTVQTTIKILNDGNHEIGYLSISSDGTVQVYRDGYVGFTASGNKGIGPDLDIMAHYLI